MQFTHKIKTTGQKVYKQVAEQLQLDGIETEEIKSPHEKRYFEECIKPLTDDIFIDFSMSSNSISSLSTLIQRYKGGSDVGPSHN